MITITEMRTIDKEKTFIGYRAEAVSTAQAYKLVCKLSQYGFDFFAYENDCIQILFRTKSQLKKHDEFLKFQNIWYKFA